MHRKRNARLFALGFAAMFMLSAVIVGVTLGVQRQTPTEATSVVLDTRPFMTAVGYNGTFRVYGPAHAMGLVSLGEPYISSSWNDTFQNRVHMTWTVPVIVTPGHGISVISQPSAWQTNSPISWPTFDAAAIDGTGLVTMPDPNVTASVPFHRGDTGAFLGSITVTDLPHTNHIFSIGSPVALTPPADHTWGGWSGLSTTRNIGNGGTLARQYIWPVFNRIQRQITWNPNGGHWTNNLPSGVSGAAINTTTNRTSNEGQGLTPADTRPGTLYKEGYHFTGWSPSGAVPASNQTRVAQWEQIAPTIYTATFYLHGGSIAEHTNTYFMPIVDGMRTPQPRDPVRLGYTFRGWFTTATGNTQFNFTTPRNSNQTIHAQWTPLDGNYIVLHNAPNLTYEQSQWQYQINRPFTLWLPGTEIMGEYFLGWFTNPEFTGTPVVAVSSTASGVQHLFARWA